MNLSEILAWGIAGVSVIAIATWTGDELIVLWVVVGGLLFTVSLVGYGLWFDEHLKNKRK